MNNIKRVLNVLINFSETVAYLLVNKSVEVDPIDDDKRTPLMLALNEGKFGFITNSKHKKSQLRK
jgi:hypothetical protein